MKRQTRAFMIREKTATFLALIDACNTVKNLLQDSPDIGDVTTDKLTDLWTRLERRIFEHMPSNIEEADIKWEFMNNILSELKEKSREIDCAESVVLLQSLNRMMHFYRSHYNHATKRIKQMEGAE